MRQSSWSLGIVALVLLGLVAVGGTTVGGASGVHFAASGILALLASLYVLAGMASGQRSGHRMPAQVRSDTQPSRVAGRRVF